MNLLRDDWVVGYVSDILSVAAAKRDGYYFLCSTIHTFGTTDSVSALEIL